MLFLDCCFEIWEAAEGIEDHLKAKKKWRRKKRDCEINLMRQLWPTVKQRHMVLSLQFDEVFVGLRFSAQARVLLGSRVDFGMMLNDRLQQVHVCAIFLKYYLCYHTKNLFYYFICTKC